MKRIYLDYAASTPVRSEAKKIMLPYFSEDFGNPGSLHSFGQDAMGAVDGAREKIAKAINADFREVIFTSGATEANNLALRGSFAEIRRRVADLRGNDFSVSLREVRDNPRLRLVISAIEHESVLDTAYALEREGVEVVVLPVDKKGIVDLKKLESSLDERTVLGDLRLMLLERFGAELGPVPDRGRFLPARLLRILLAARFAAAA